MKGNMCKGEGTGRQEEKEGAICILKGAVEKKEKGKEGAQRFAL